MSNFTVTRKLTEIAFEIDEIGGYKNHVAARILNAGVLLGALLDIIRYLGLLFLKSPYEGLNNRIKRIDAKSTKIDSLTYLIQIIKHLALIILTPLGMISPRLILTIYREFLPGPKELKRKFYSDCRIKILSNNPDVKEENLKKIAKFVYSFLIKDSDFFLKTTAHTIPDVKFLINYPENKIFVQMPKIFGRGSYKTVYEGCKFTVERDSCYSWSIHASMVALLRVPKKIPEAQNENRIASKFISKHLVKMSEDTFYDAEEWVMVSDKIPFFYSRLIPKSKNSSNLCSTPENFDNAHPYTFNDLIYGLMGIAEALAEIHEAGHIHRDIKPANIGIQWNKEGFLADLGFVIESNKIHHRSLTAKYAPPELVHNGKWKVNSQTAEGDLWSLGLTILQIMHPLHRLPRLMEVKNNPETFKDTLFCDWPAKNEAEIKLQHLISKLLSIDPADRGTAYEVFLTLKKIYSLSTADPFSVHAH